MSSLLGALIPSAQRLANAPRTHGWPRRPNWGTGAAVVACGAYLAKKGTARLAARVPLGGWGPQMDQSLNLLPVWQLDAAEAFHALSRQQALLAAAALARLFFTRRGGSSSWPRTAGLPSFGREAPTRGDRNASLQICSCGSAALMGAYGSAPVPLGARPYSHTPIDS